MRQYILRRLVFGLMVLWGVSVIVFLLMRLLPGDAVIVLLGEELTTREQIEAVRTKLGLDKPIHTQYFVWVKDILRGNLGRSLQTDEPVLGRIMERLPVSLEIALLAMATAIMIAIPVGVISAIRQDTTLDYSLRLVSITGLSTPSFWLGTILLVLPSIFFQWVPPLGFVNFFEDPLGNLQQVVFPVMVLGFTLSAGVMRLTRSALLEVLRQDYIRTAWSKGLREFSVISRHALKNALIPVVTLWGVQIGRLLGGTVILETIFSLPGIGRLTLEAITNRDYTQVQANVLFFALIFFTSNLIVDITYGWLDPRIKYQ